MKSSKAIIKRRAAEEEGNYRHLRLCSCFLVADKEQGPGQDEESTLSKEKPEKPSIDTRLQHPSLSQSQMNPPFTQMPWGESGGGEGYTKVLKRLNIQKELI